MAQNFNPGLALADNWPQFQSSQRSLHSLLKREGQDRLNYLREAQKPRRMFKEASCICGINSWNCCRTNNGWMAVEGEVSRKQSKKQSSLFCSSRFGQTWTLSWVVLSSFPRRENSENLGTSCRNSIFHYNLFCCVMSSLYLHFNEARSFSMSFLSHIFFKS